MGFASYLEDIITRVSTIDRIANDQSTSTYSRASESEELRKQNQRLQATISKLRKEVLDLKGVLQQVSKEYAVKDGQLQRELEKTDSLRKKVSDEKSLRMDYEKTGLDQSELVLDYRNRFQGLSEITKSNAWYKDKSKIKQLESIIEASLRMN